MKAILCSWFFLCSIWGNAADTLTITVDPNSPQFVVTLPANPTTGYRWSVTKYDTVNLQMVSSRFIAPQTKRVGAGGNMTFIFAPAKGKAYPQSTQMVFTYARPWESTSGTVKNVVVKFKK